MSTAAGARRIPAAVVIPARFGSSRLPGKPLLVAAGRTLIEHVHRRVAAATRVERIVVATDDERIAAVVRSFGGEALLTSPDHATGTDRIGEVLPRIPHEVIVNVQGDEPGIEPELVDRLVALLQDDPSLAVATAAARWPAGVDPADPNRVKVVTDLRGRALYFSRAPIPCRKAGAVLPAGRPWLHVGIYAFRRAALERFLTLPRGPLEQIESLEQLRLLENGLAIGVALVDDAPAGIDTPEDFEAFRSRLEAGSRAVST